MTASLTGTGRLIAKGAAVNVEHTATVTVLAQDLAFKKGDALGKGSFTACTGEACVSGRFPLTTIRIK
jgi:hypothetical protein